MEVKPLRTIGGLVLTMFDDAGGNGHLTLQIPREVLSFLGVQCIQQIGPDASEDLILACRAMVNAADKAAQTDEDPPWRTLNEETQAELHGIISEDIRDSVDEVAIDELDKMSLTAVAELMILSEVGEETEEGEDPSREQIEAWIEAHLKKPEG